jgi:hypothetical protein
VCRATPKERPRVGGGAQGGQSETLEGSYLTFTSNTTALHSVPLARQGRAVRQNESPNRRRAGFREPSLAPSGDARGAPASCLDPLAYTDLTAAVVLHTYIGSSKNALCESIDRVAL